MSVRTELERVLREVLGCSDTEMEFTRRALPIEWIEPEIYRDSIEEARRLVRDPEGAPVLACGLSLGCDIVCGDKDLQEARQRRVRVRKPSELVRRT